MRHRSPIWITLAQYGRFHFETKARIGTKEYTAISAPRIDRAVMSTPLTVGNCTAATLNLSILTEDNIAASAPIVILGRLTDGVNYSEWLEFGTFYINQRDTSYEGLITVDCYDAMLKANQTYLQEGSSGTEWPKTMKTVVEEIAQRIGVSVDPRTQINVGGDYIVPEPVDLTMTQVLGYIGACHGGNWIITEDNALRLVPLATAPTAKAVTGETPESIIPQTYYITDENDLSIGTPEGHSLVWAINGSADPVDGLTNVTAVLGQLTNGIAVTVTGITMSNNMGGNYTAGTKDGYVITIESNPYASQNICNALYEKLRGLVYEPFTASKTVYDPATELGDQIVIGTKVQSTLCTSKITMDIAFRSDITAPNSEALSAEYPYLTERKKSETAIKQVQEQLNNSDYATKVQFEKTQSDIRSEVSRALSAEETLSSQITQNEEQIALRVTKGDVSSHLSLESGNIDIGSNRISIVSDKFTLTHEGEITAVSAYIEGEIVATSGIIGGCEIKDGILIVPAAQIADKLVASQIDASDLKVSSANITGTLTIGQLPNTVAEMDDIPTNVSELNNDSDYQSPSGVVSIVDGRITADYIEALEISVKAAQITGKLTASQIDASKLKVSAANITGSLTIGQLPDTVAETSDIPTSLSELDNDSNFVTESGVVSIVDGRITADYVVGLKCQFTSGKIGGWTISSSEIYNTSSGINAGSSYTKQSLISSGTSPVRFYAGNGNRVDGKFVVLDDGSLYAAAAEITGVINANSGRVGSWYISNGIIRSAEGVYGTYSYSTTGTDLRTVSGYAFTALTSTGIMYYIQSSNDFENSATLATISGLTISRNNNSGGSDGGVTEL